MRHVIDRPDDNMRVVLEFVPDPARELSFWRWLIDEANKAHAGKRVPDVKPLQVPQS